MISVNVRMPEPGESKEAYQAYLDGLFAPLGAEVKRLRDLAAALMHAEEETANADDV